MDHAENGSRAVDLTAQIREKLAEREGGRFHGLRVRQIDSKVVLSGHASSYDIFQLALAAARELAAGATLEIRVEIGSH